MQHALKWFEIPVADMERARKFYSNLLNIQLEDLELANQLKMALFPAEEGKVSGALCYYPGFYKPSAEGVTIYLNADPDLAIALEKLEGLGGKLIVPKNQISEERGYMSIIMDTEGTRIGLMSRN